MKELSIEEKAKAYDNIIEKANKMHSENCEACQICIEELIPELKESDDEMIRKVLLDFLRNELKKRGDEEWDWGFHTTDVIAWLEKQGEQKPADKVKPKFKVGDWVVTDKGDTVQIGAVNNGYYTICNGMDFNMSYVDKCWHRWTIDDAKDGDVLAAHECLVLFKEIDGLNIKCYCTYHYMGHNPSFYVDTLQNKTAFQPATKEQRDTLMKAMADAGYTFDFDKKELKKIEQNPAWSEEDEYRLFHTISDLKFLRDTISIDPKYVVSIIDMEREIKWLKSLKDRVQPQPKQELSEEDEEKRKRIMHRLSLDGTINNKDLADINDWLKSLRPQAK